MDFTGDEALETGESVYLSGQQEDGTHAQTKYFRREEYLPVNTIVELDDREFRVDSVNFEQGTVSLQDMTLAKKPGIRSSERNRWVYSAFV